MKKTIVFLFLSSLIFAQSDSVAVNLANAERSFSNASEQMGIKNSFLAFLSDDCVMFNPYPVNGKELHKNRPANSASLLLYPVFVEVASSGDFGFTYGFSVSAKNDSSSYIRVWRKEKEWEIAIAMLEPFKK